MKVGFSTGMYDGVIQFGGKLSQVSSSSFGEKVNQLKKCAEAEKVKLT